MRTALVFCLGMMMLLVIQPLQAIDESFATGRFINASIEQSEIGLKSALEAPSPGLQLTAASTTRQLKELFPAQEFSSLIIPLMRIVKDENAETSTRIVAAIALHGLHSRRGDFAISRTAEFTDNSRVRNVCSWLAYYRRAGEKLQNPIDVSTLKPVILHPFPEPLPEIAF